MQANRAVHIYLLYWESSMLCVEFSGKIERSARTCLEIVYFKGKMRLYKQFSRRIVFLEVKMALYKQF